VLHRLLSKDICAENMSAELVSLTLHDVVALNGAKSPH
jgi:hypothetical protein